MKEKSKVIFFHMNQLGDLLFSLPLLAAAREQWKDFHITSIVRPALVPLLEAGHLVDRVIPRPATLAGKLSLLRNLRNESFICSVSFSESPETSILAYAAGIPVRIGFASAPLSFLYTKKARRSGVPSLLNNRRLATAAELVNVPLDYVGLVRTPNRDKIAADDWLARENIHSQQLIVIAPGASVRRRDKCWHGEKWTAVLNDLIARGFAPVLCGAPRELETLSLLASAANPGVRIFSGDSLLSLAALFGRARLFAGIDSGAMHLAAAMARPVVALFGPTDPEQVGPQPLNQHTIIKKNDIATIEPQEVLKAIYEKGNLV
ncbi:MAG: hypothetical protein A2314_04340 [Elusimicrobia bacterium RIFOXYB2_FULL_50_12]|nr:MAG: hypothetical protein A2314_04340 [Elusimicrobia bacterium RIFOXYB2_FULL_50_12]